MGVLQMRTNAFKSDDVKQDINGFLAVIPLRRDRLTWIFSMLFKIKVLKNMTIKHRDLCFKEYIFVQHSLKNGSSD